MVSRTPSPDDELRRLLCGLTQAMTIISGRAANVLNARKEEGSRFSLYGPLRPMTMSDKASLGILPRSPGAESAAVFHAKDKVQSEMTDDMSEEAEEAQPVAKRRRLMDSDVEMQGHFSHGPKVHQTATPMSVDSDKKDHTPRRLNRKGKGQNESLHNMPGMMFVDTWKNSRLIRASGNA